jgi:protocatechuate 3,4-dioxygenase beta subunit
VGAAVHIWHANAEGRYSGYEGHSPDVVELTPGHLPVETEARFLRGHQVTSDTGLVEFTTIVPAWYSFRTPHIHAKVLLPNNQSLTTQLYFPETINTMVRETVAPYKARLSPLVTNRSDPVISSSKGAPGGWLKIVKTEVANVDALEGSLTIGVQADEVDTPQSLTSRPAKT